METIAGVDVYQNSADLAGGKLCDGPLREVGGEDSHPVLFSYADSQQSPGAAIHLFPQFAISKAYALVEGDEGFMVRINLDHAVKHIPDGKFK